MIEQIIFPLFIDRDISDDSMEFVNNMATQILRICGTAPKKLIIPENMWFALYVYCMKHAPYNVPKESSFYKITITTSVGRVEVRPE